MFNEHSYNNLLVKWSIFIAYSDQISCSCLKPVCDLWRFSHKRFCYCSPCPSVLILRVFFPCVLAWLALFYWKPNTVQKNYRQNSSIHDGVTRTGDKMYEANVLWCWVPGKMRLSPRKGSKCEEPQQAGCVDASAQWQEEAGAMEGDGLT